LHRSCEPLFQRGLRHSPGGKLITCVMRSHLTRVRGLKLLRCYEADGGPPHSFVNLLRP
jgi:hypothetical protein